MILEAMSCNRVDLEERNKDARTAAVENAKYSIPRKMAKKLHLASEHLKDEKNIFYKEPNEHSYETF